MSNQTYGGFTLEELKKFGPLAQSPEGMNISGPNRKVGAYFAAAGALADLVEAVDRHQQAQGEATAKVDAICKHCNQEYPVPLTRAGNATRNTLCNFCDCPHCGKRNDLWICVRPGISGTPAPAAVPDSEAFTLLMRDITEQFPCDPDHKRAVCIDYDWMYGRTQEAFRSHRAWLKFQSMLSPDDPAAPARPEPKIHNEIMYALEQAKEWLSGWASAEYQLYTVNRALGHINGEGGPSITEELAAAKDKAEDLAIFVELVRKALGVPEEPHQGMQERIMEAGQALYKLEARCELLQNSLNDFILKPVPEALPPEGLPFIGFHEDWVDDDFNPNGARECHRYGDGTQYQSARWNGVHDCWDVDDQPPTHWCYFPDPADIRLAPQTGEGHG